MNKILASLLVLILSISSTFAYNPSLKDTRTLNSVYKTIDLINDNQPSKVENLYNKLQKILPSFKKDNQQKYILTELSNYIWNKINVPKEIFSVEENIQYDVIEIIDWDTIKINYNWKVQNIRMIGIDSPENSTTRFWYVEKLWDEAKQKLVELIWNNKITIELDETQWEYDKYNRLLAYIFVWSLSINGEMIKSWYAKEYTYNKAYKYQSEFKVNQKNAEENKLWIWSNTSETTTINNTENKNYKFYTSSYYSAKLYYCETDLDWKWLSNSYLRVYNTESELLNDSINSGKTLNKKCN